MRCATIFLLATLLGGCATPHPSAGPGEAFFDALASHCGKAYEGRLVEGTAPGDAEIGRERLVMHVRHCGPREIRIPFHVGDDRSRTWIVRRRADDVELKHAHRHADGRLDAVTNYGGATRGDATGLTLEFHADEETASMIPAARTNVWTLSLEPAGTFTYALRREAEDRRFRAEFDLSRPVATPPAAW